MAIDVVRAWKDLEYRETLTKEEQASLPPHPAGISELSDAELEKIAGGLYNCKTNTCVVQGTSKCC